MKIETKKDVERFIISAELSEFEEFLNNLLFKIYGYSAKKVGRKTGNDFRTHLEYLIFGTIFDYKISTADNGLDICLSLSNGFLSDNDRENTLIHIEHVTQEVNKKFRSGGFPLAFQNLIPDGKYLLLAEERWEESILTQQAKAYLATIVLLGSVLEAMLLYKIESNWAFVQSSGHYPKKNNGGIKRLNEWKLSEMIDTSFELNWISKNEEAFSHALRDYRNFIHPWKHLENRLAIPDEGSCEMSRNVVKMVFENLLRSNSS
jgi:hypothetical protein